MTMLPEASSTETVGDVVKDVPSCTPPTGCVVKTSFEATPDVRVTLDTVLDFVQVCQTAVMTKL
jgi:hypothetical protein